MGLLLLIIVSIVLFSGFSVYYQSSFKNVSLEYQNKLEQLSTVSDELTSQKAELNETYSLRLKAEQDRKALDTRYKDVTGENDQLIKDNANLKAEVSNTKNQLADKTAELDATKVLLARTQSDLSSANKQISRLKSDLDDVCDSYTSLNGGTEHDEC
ncbi:hypothetical protein ISS07_04600 [Candidatus Woesearchaeota archaeon]|nr:hypothetical protein [Candidatus Woesearchaeota archaeon]